MEDYEQSPAVVHMHNIPRFGHTNRFASLASSDEAIQSRYIHGIIAFLVFLGLLAVVWFLVLIMLKFTFGKTKVGCAASGRPVDVSQLRRDGIRKSERKRRIRRNWRVQNCFLAFAVLVPALSFVFVNHGLHPYFSALDDASELADTVRTNSMAGVKVVSNLVAIRERLDALVTSLDITKYCPNAASAASNTENNNEDGEDGDVESSGNSIINSMPVLKSVWDGVQHNMENFNNFVDDHARDVAIGMSRVNEAAYYFTKKVEHVMQYDWKIKCLLIILNVINLLMIAGVLMTRNGINSVPYQTLLCWFVVPSFILLIVMTIAFTGASAAAAILNADFCSGGGAGSGANVVDVRSPKGTLLDILAEKGYDGDTDLPVRIIEYYTTDKCKGPSPIEFLYKFGAQVNEKYREIQELLVFLGEFDPIILDAACGTSISPLNESLYQLADKVDELGDVIEGGTNLTSCDNVQPIADSLLHGSTCTGGPRGSAALFGTSLAIVLVGLIMLSTRAALYNPVLIPRRVKRREREFREYQDYMHKFYDTTNWKMDPPTDPTKQKNIAPAGTFDTEDDDDGRSMSSSIGSPRSAHSPSPREQSGTSVFIGSPHSTAKSSASSPFPGSRMVAAAAAMAGIHDWNEPEVEYYSSDSDDDDNDNRSNDGSDNGMSFIGTQSIVSGLSNITDLVQRVFLTRKSGHSNNNQNRHGGLRDDESSISSRASSVLTGPRLWTADFRPASSISVRRVPAPPPAAFIAPEHRQQHESHQFQWDDAAGFDNNDVEQQEMHALKPAQHHETSSIASELVLKVEDTPPVKPKKHMKARARTFGASKMEGY